MTFLKSEIFIFWEMYYFFLLNFFFVGKLLKSFSFLTANLRLFVVLFCVLQSEGAPADEGLLGTEPETPGGSEAVWRPDQRTRVHRQHRRSASVSWLVGGVRRPLTADGCLWLLSVDVFFTGTADGKIVKLIGRRIHTVTRLGKLPCGET